MQPTSWATTDPTVVALAQDRSTDLIDIIGTAGPCAPMIMLRGADCELQQSLDGGTTWTTISGWDSDIVPCFLPSSYTPPPQTSLRMDGCDLQFTLDGGSSWVSVPGWSDALGFCFAFPGICYAWGSYGSGPLDTDWPAVVVSGTPYGTFTSGWWQSISVPTGGGFFNEDLQVHATFTSISAVTLEVDGFFDGAGDATDRYVIDSNSDTYNLPFTSGAFTATIPITGAITSLEIHMRTRLTAGTANNFLYGLRIHATGINPWGTSNCA
jgi:hypothetical protein